MPAPLPLLTRRIGVVADTHVGEFLDALPDGVLEALEGCDLILHAGDLSVPGVLDPTANTPRSVGVNPNGTRPCPAISMSPLSSRVTESGTANDASRWTSG